MSTSVMSERLGRTRVKMFTGLIVVSVISGLLATPAMAGFTVGDTVAVQYLGENPSSPVTVVSPVYTGVMDAGIFRIVVDGTSMGAFCLDIYGLVSPASLTYDVMEVSDAPVPGGPMGAAAAMDIMKVWSWYQSSGKSNLDAAAAQCAVWEITDNYDFDSGLFEVSTPAVKAAAEQILADLPGLTDYTPMLALTNAEQQDYGVPIIPAPGALLLGSLGACLVGYARRRTQM